jgi:hypothetical protein
MATSQDEKKVIFKMLSDFIKKHEEAEERTFYALLSTVEEIRKDVMKCYEEHAILTSILEDLLTGIETHINERWEVRFDIFQDILLSHYRHKQRTLFPLARAYLSEGQLISIKHGKPGSPTLS